MVITVPEASNLSKTNEIIAFWIWEGTGVHLGGYRCLPKSLDRGGYRCAVWRVQVCILEGTGLPKSLDRGGYRRAVWRVQVST